MEPSSLDLFLLGLVETGVDTPYLFRERAGLSVGATLPALKRLEQARFVERQEKAARNKQQFKTTKSGRLYLRSQLKHIMERYAAQPPTDVESVLRAASLTMSLGDSNAAQNCLRSAAQDRERRAAALKATAISRPQLSGFYSYWVSLVQSARLHAEAETLANVATEISGPKSKAQAKPRRQTSGNSGS